MIYKSWFWENYSYDWFCAPGSHLALVRAVCHISRHYVSLLHTLWRPRNHNVKWADDRWLSVHCPMQSFSCTHKSLYIIIFPTSTFPLQRPHPWNYISPSGEWKWTLVDTNRHTLASSRVKTSMVSASDVWAWPMHKMLFWAFQIASTARILRLNPCALDSRFLTENLPFFSTALLLRPPSFVKPWPWVRRRWMRGTVWPQRLLRSIAGPPTWLFVLWSIQCGRLGADTCIRKRSAFPTSLKRVGPLKFICPSLRCSPPSTAPSSPLGTSWGVQATYSLQQLLKVRDTSGFLPSELLQVAGFVHARRDAQRFPPASVFPALAFTASLGHASTHEDAVSSPLLRPVSFPSLQGDVQSGDPTLVSPLIHFTPLPQSAFLHTWRDLPGVSPWILRTIQFGYTLQFARNDRGGLVRHAWPEGCLRPHPGVSEAQEVLQVRLRVKGLPVQGSSLWASSGPKDVHQVYGCSSGHIQEQMRNKIVVIYKSGKGYYAIS